MYQHLQNVEWLVCLCVCAHTCVCIVHLHQVSTLAVIHDVCADLHDDETSDVSEGVSTPGVPPGQTREHRDEQQLTHCLKSTSQHLSIAGTKVATFEA